MHRIPRLKPAIIPTITAISQLFSQMNCLLQYLWVLLVQIVVLPLADGMGTFRLRNLKTESVSSRGQPVTLTHYLALDPDCVYDDVMCHVITTSNHDNTFPSHCSPNDQSRSMFQRLVLEKYSKHFILQETSTKRVIQVCNTSDHDQYKLMALKTDNNSDLDFSKHGCQHIRRHFHKGTIFDRYSWQNHLKLNLLYWEETNSPSHQIGSHDQPHAREGGDYQTHDDSSTELGSTDELDASLNRATWQKVPIEEAGSRESVLFHPLLRPHNSRHRGIVSHNPPMTSLSEVTNHDNWHSKRWLWLVEECSSGGGGGG